MEPRRECAIGALGRRAGGTFAHSAGPGTLQPAGDSLAAEGAEIALLARDPDRLAAAAVRLCERGGRVLALSADITDDKAVRAAIARVAEELGGVDILVNNAATSTGASSPRDLADPAKIAVQARFESITPSFHGVAQSRHRTVSPAIGPGRAGGCRALVPRDECP
jgi:NAD(P)-dependent dehydrogenase (short-subunit alcohol dehydrogenase family)